MAYVSRADEYGKIIIDGNEYEIDDIYNFGYLPIVKCGNMEFYVAEDTEAAGEKAKEYWQDMIDNDPKEFTCIIGEERLLQWALGRSDGYGISSAQEFLDKVADHPEEEFGSYDGNELTVNGRGRWNRKAKGYKQEYVDQPGVFFTSVTQAAEDEIGFQPGVAYRHN